MFLFTYKLKIAERIKAKCERQILRGDVKGEALENLIRDGALSMHHVTGTAKMALDEYSVVDSKLRVYGVKNLRIADSSIMPTITTGNTQKVWLNLEL